MSAGYVTYRDARSGRAFEHTVIAAEYQGMGFALDEARAAGRTVLPFCPFVRSFIQQHPAYLDLVGQPQRFGLTVQTPDPR
ncbi:MAG: GNAT family N-acetyltransferase [Propionibacteriaceae bacterium]